MSLAENLVPKNLYSTPIVSPTMDNTSQSSQYQEVGNIRYDYVTGNLVFCPLAPFSSQQNFYLIPSVSSENQFNCYKAQNSGNSILFYYYNFFVIVNVHIEIADWFFLFFTGIFKVSNEEPVPKCSSKNSAEIAETWFSDDFQTGSTSLSSVSNHAVEGFSESMSNSMMV